MCVGVATLVAVAQKRQVAEKTLESFDELPGGRSDPWKGRISC